MAEQPHSEAGTAAAATDREFRRVAEGVVTSDKPNKSIRVQIERIVKHRRYGKYLRRRTVVHVHDEQNDAREGDVVEIMESRPISKTKHWRLTKIVRRLIEPQGASAGQEAS